MRPERFELPIRIVVVDPIPGLAIGLQRGQAAKAQFVAPASQSTEAAAFGIEATVDGRLDDGRPRLLGPAVQGPPTAHFVYLAVGTHPCRPDGVLVRRPGQIPLGGFSRDQIEALAPGWQADAPKRSR